LPNFSCFLADPFYNSIFPAMFLLLGSPLMASAVLKKSSGIWLFKPLVILVDGLGHSQGNISNAWENTSLDKEKLDQNYQQSEDAREMIEKVLELAWAD